MLYTYVNGAAMRRTIIPEFDDDEGLALGRVLMGLIGSSFAARAAPDGLTLLLVVGSHVVPRGAQPSQRRPP